MEKTDSTRRLVRFGVFEVDLRAGELRKNGLKIKLQEQPFQILATLLERPGEIVTREELQRKLWSNDTFVDFDNSLNKAVNKIREAVGDSADNPRFVETMARRGYRFIAPVEETCREYPQAPVSGNQEAERNAGTSASQEKNAVAKVDYVAELRRLGYTNLSVDELIKLRNHGVTPEFIEGLKTHGYGSLSIEQLLKLRNHGVTAEFIQRMKSQGFPRLSIEQLVKLRNAGS
jgi:DNA-binding winged helix-turn-helix (wHTH) protein